MREEYNTLTSRVQQSLLDLEAVIDRTSLLMGKALKKNDDGYLDGVALNLHGFYTGVEQIFEDIARTIDRSLPSGWHHDLLLQMSGELKSVRPPVISRETRHCLDEYRSFRHVVRNIYTFNLKSPRIQNLAEQLHDCYLKVKDDLDDFMLFLEKLGGND